MTTALLVIDAQASFPERPYWSSDELPRYLTRQNALIAGFAKANLPIVRIFHVEPEGAFSKASGFIRPIEGLANFEPTFTIEKHAHSAFAGTELATLLKKHGIRRLVISGIRTEQCCETTTRDGSDRGFEVDYVTEATLTFPMQHSNKKVFSAADICERTELVLSGRFATICSVDEALPRAAQM
jgi:nicotinamidase-related amidase